MHPGNIKEIENTCWQSLLQSFALELCWDRRHIILWLVGLPLQNTPVLYCKKVKMSPHQNRRSNVTMDDTRVSTTSSCYLQFLKCRLHIFRKNHSFPCQTF